MVGYTSFNIKMSLRTKTETHFLFSELGGVIPITDLKTRQKLLNFEKPTLSAISPMGISVLLSRYRELCIL